MLALSEHSESKCWDQDSNLGRLAPMVLQTIPIDRSGIPANYFAILLLLAVCLTASAVVPDVSLLGLYSQISNLATLADKPASQQIILLIFLFLKRSFKYPDLFRKYVF